MIQQRSLALLGAAERQIVRQKWRQNGQCLRCFHASRQQMAEEGNGKPANDNGTPYNAPKRGPNRQERAAKVSSEVSAIAADLPKANLKGRNAEAEGAQSRGTGVTPQAKGKNVGPGRMGENDSVRKEGPFAQPVGRVTRESDEDPTTSKEARGVRTPDSKLEDPEQGGASVMEPLGAVSEAAGASKPTAGTEEAVATNASPVENAKPVAPAENVAPSKGSPTAEEYLTSGLGSSTLLASNFAGMVADRASLVAPRSSPSAPAPAEVVRRLKHQGGHLLAFHSPAEERAYRSPREKLIAERDALQREIERVKKEQGLGWKSLPTELRSKYHGVREQIQAMPNFTPMPIRSRKAIVNRMVSGQYDEQILFKPGMPAHEQPVAKTVTKELLKNPTYLNKDMEKLRTKLRSLLPAPVAKPAAKKPAVRKPEAKKLEVKKSEAKKPEVKKSEVKKPAAKKPAKEAKAN